MLSKLKVWLIIGIYSFPACATELFTPEPSAAIHEIMVSTGTYTGVPVYLWTSVGKMVDGACQYEKDTSKHDRVIYRTEYLYLNGDTLKSLIGPGYTCAATNVQKVEGGPIQRDQFKLINNPSGDEYVRSDPSSGSVHL